MFKSVRFVRLVKNYSTKPVVANKAEYNYENQLKQTDFLSGITPKSRVKKPQRPPFAKNLFIGVFDKEMLFYPQEELDTISAIDRTVTELHGLMLQKQFSQSVNFNKFFRQNLADYRMIGLQAPQLLNGREAGVTEMTRFLEVLSEHKLRHNLISNELLGAQILLKFGSDELKNKYLTKVMSGEICVAFAGTEMDSNQYGVMGTTGVLSKDKKSWVLNGEKTLVCNGNSADLLLVLATSKQMKLDSKTEGKVSLFIVEKHFPGVKCEGLDETKDLCKVVFDNTPIPTENVLGTVHAGENVLRKILPEVRLGFSAASLAQAKRNFNRVSEYFLKQTNGLHETNAVTSKIGQMCTKLYALESMLYFTTGVFDRYENQDCELESTICNLFGKESTLDATLNYIDLLSPHSNLQHHWSQEFHREAMDNSIFLESRDHLRLLIATMGLQHAGEEIQEDIIKLRNPLFYPAFVMKRMWQDRGHAADNPRLSLKLKFEMHPSLSMASDMLEYSVLRLQFGTQVLFARYGNELLNSHVQLRRLADCIVDIYAMHSCLARASRAYCTGVQHSDLEMILANSFVVDAKERVAENVRNMHIREYGNNDDNYCGIGKKVFQAKNYCLWHPIARNI